jgi:DNA-binding NtrC family response regulator
MDAQTEALSYGKCETISPLMKEALERASRLFDSLGIVVLCGETGTGKEGVAEYLNKKYGKGQKLGKIDISALQDTLLASDLFGNTIGAFTGAKVERISTFKIAEVVFIDELNRATPDILAKLSRLIERGEYKPLGSNKWEESKAKIILGTNTPLEKMVDNGILSEDIYYRLKSFCVNLPSLDERGPDEKEFLAEHFLQTLCSQNEKSESFTDAARDFIREHKWTGNVRELKNELKRAIALSTDSVIDAAALDHLSADSSSGSDTLDFIKYTNKELNDKYYRALVAKAEHQQYRMKYLERVSGQSRKTLLEKIRKLGIDSSFRRAS